MLRGIGPVEIGLILVIVLILFGAGKVPQIGGALGKSIREFRKASRGDYDNELPAGEKKAEEASASSLRGSGDSSAAI